MFPAMKKLVSYAKAFNLKFLIGLAVFCLLAAVVNNLRAPEGKAVEWFGTQDILEKPADLL